MVLDKCELKLTLVQHGTDLLILAICNIVREKPPMCLSGFVVCFAGLNNECAKGGRIWSDGPLLAVGLCCVWSLMKDPLLHEKRSAVVEGKGERKKPLLGFAGDQYKRERGGRVKQADCLESNKTRRLRGAGSSFGSFD